MIEESTPNQAQAARRFSRRQAWIAGVALALVAIGARFFDFRVAETFFYDRTAQAFIGAHSWWAVDLIHEAGGWFVRLVGLAALVIAVAGSRLPRLSHLRNGAAFVALALVLCPAVVSGLKQVTNIDCPRDLAHFGGDRPYVGLFSHRPDSLPRAACYPGSHSSTGFALLSFFFVLRDRRPRHARRALAAAVLVGSAFSIGQQARGAHFLSHDLASAAIAWALLLILDRWLLESPAKETPRLIPRIAYVPLLDGVPPGGPGIGRRQTAYPANARRRRTGVRGVLQRVFRTRVPLRIAAPEWRRRSGPGSRAVRADQGDAEPFGVSR